MAGRNQHHIPQFFQRGFGVPRSGKPKEIWKYEKGALPKLSKIKRTAAEDFFYSTLSEDGTKTLDDQITDLETPISRTVAALRRSPLGSVIDPATAAQVIIHLAPRTSHLRSVFAYGMAGLIAGAREIFTDQENLVSLLGIGEDHPNDRFKENFSKHIAEEALLAQLNLPPAVLEQVSFRLLKENFFFAPEEQASPLVSELTAIALNVPEIARDGHGQALTQIIADGTKRDDLLDYKWTIQPGPSEGAILPDCVAFALVERGGPRPFVGLSSESIRVVVLPLATETLLVGTKEGEDIPDLGAVNAYAAECSHGFFLAATDMHKDLIARIGRVATTDVDEGLDGAFHEFRLERQLPVNAEHVAVTGPSDTAPIREEVDKGPVSGNFSYQVTCFDFGDQVLAERIADVLKYVVGDLSRVMPLDRLDGITFAVDYRAALTSVDRGRQNIAAPKTVDEDIGTGVGMTVLVEREGLIKGRIVLTAHVGLGLIDENAQEKHWALHALVHQLALVSMAQLTDEALPDFLLKPLTDSYEGPLLVSIHSALDAYAASRFSACFGDRDEILRIYQELLVSILTTAQQKIVKARFTYRYDGDIGKLVDLAQPLIECILNFSGQLLGHADGLLRSPFDEEGVVKAALKEAGLLAWFKSFESDLRDYWDHRGQWKSLEELYRYNRHVERIFWKFGMFWSQNKDGARYLHIPLVSDAQALMEATAQGVPVPNFSSPEGEADGSTIAS